MQHDAVVVVVPLALARLWREWATLASYFVPRSTPATISCILSGHRSLLVLIRLFYLLSQYEVYFLHKKNNSQERPGFNVVGGHLQSGSHAYIEHCG